MDSSVNITKKNPKIENCLKSTWKKLGLQVNLEKTCSTSQVKEEALKWGTLAKNRAHNAFIWKQANSSSKKPLRWGIPFLAQSNLQLIHE